MKQNFYSKLKKLSPLTSWFVASIGGLVLIGSIGYGIYSYDILEKEKIKILSELEDERGRSHGLLIETRNQQEAMTYQQSIINSFQGQISSIGNTVGTLEKLAQTDKELLRKYSKIYFLNENYVPAKLTQVEEIYTFDGGGDNFLIHAEVWPYLKKLLEEARSSDIKLLVASAFRSFDTQTSLKSEYKIVYGAGTANQFSADQGYSEHQLGTAVDFTTSTAAGVFSKFQADPAYKWLKDNAYKYGFILSYPENNFYYKFEPWHWRFVGIELATFLHGEGKYFYGLDQREIDEYLIKLFD